jgi:hypothetical protein
MTLRCPQCRNRIVQKASDGVHIRSQGAIVFTPDGKCIAKCFFCKTLVELPMELQKAVLPELEQKFVIEVKRTKAS